MSYFSNKDTVVYQDDTFICTEGQGQMNMFWVKSISQNGHAAHRCGQIIGGRRGFEKQYAGDFQRWIKKIRSREYDTMQSYIRQAEDLLKQAESIRETYGFVENTRE